MIKAILYKEWIKMRALLPVAAVAVLGFTVYALLRVERAVDFRGAAHVWQIMIDKETVFIEPLRLLPALAGIAAALVQFIPEMSQRRLKLTLHLPFPQRGMILVMAAAGLGALAVLFAAQAAMVWGYMHRLLAPELTARAMMTAVPWWAAGLTLYMLTAWICLEPTWRRRVLYLLMTAGVARMFFLSDVPRAYDGMLPWIAALWLFSLLLPLLSVDRFKQGCQD